MVHKKARKQFAEDKQTKDMDYEKHVLWSDAVLISTTKTTTKNIRQRTFFLWLWRDVDELKIISDDTNYATKTRRD